MSASIPPHVSSNSLQRLILGMADDELILGHRNSEWTGYAPILEEDIAFSNIAQDEIGHSLVWYTLYQTLTQSDPDTMAFRRSSNDFTCCRLVEYPKGDFAYTVVRQFLFDAAEQVNLKDLSNSSFEALASAAQRILKEETYHLLHSQSLFERLGDATTESSTRMQAALDAAFPQSLGMFEELECEKELMTGGVYSGKTRLLNEWLNFVVPVIRGVSLTIPVEYRNGSYSILSRPEDGGRRGAHTDHLRALIADLQRVYGTAPEAKW
jgi:ring-1,2-phenylacetyl-CoA epoxidase subunit PaaC